MLRLLVCLTILLCAAPMAGAAPMDCARAAGATEKMLCRDTVLREMDSRLNTAYARALKAPTDAAHARSRPGQPSAPHPAARLQADALVQDQRRWIAWRDTCGADAACLRQRYADREVVLSHLSGPFSWEGKWWRVDASGFNPASLQIGRPVDGRVPVSWEAFRAANSGELDGVAILDDADPARANFAGKDGLRGCVLAFTQVLNQLEVVQQGDSPSCGAGNGVTYDGRYVKSAQDPNPKPSLITLGVLDTRKEDAAVRALLGDDYEYVVDTANSIDLHAASLDGKQIDVTTMFVRGLACDMKSVLMRGPRGALWIGTWQADANGGTELRYYTTVAADRHTLPKTIAAMRPGCSGEPATLRTMP